MVLRDHYYLLALDVEEERLAGAAGLIQELESAEDEAEWEYATTRLVKGLTSSRGQARLGFSTALAEVLALRVARGYSVAAYMEALEEHTNWSRNMKNGHEERGVLFGRLFGLQVLQNCGEVLQEDVAARGAVYTRFVDTLVELAVHKLWLRETCVFTLVRSLKTMEGVSEETWHHVVRAVHEAGLTLTPEGIAVYLATPAKFRSLAAAALGAGAQTWPHGNPLAKGSLKLLARALKEGGAEEDVANKGLWQPRLHFVWGELVRELGALAEDEADATPKRRKTHAATTTFLAFYTHVVDETLFAQSASHERKFWGFLVFEHCVSTLPADQLSLIFTPNLMRCLVNQSAQPGRYLHRAARHALQQVVAAVKEDASKAVVVLRQLWLHNGGLTFDHLTKTRTTADIVLSVSAAGESGATIRAVRDLYLEVLFHPGTETPLKRQRWAVDGLGALVRTKRLNVREGTDLAAHRDSITANLWIDEVLYRLVMLGFFIPHSEDDSEYAAYTPEASQLAIDRVLGILGDILHIARPDSKTWAYKAVSQILKLSFAESSVNPDVARVGLRVEVDASLAETRERLWRTLRKIRTKRTDGSTSNTSQLALFELLFLMVLLQFYSGDEESLQVLEELHVCFQTFVGVDGEESKLRVILTEVLMGFMARPSVLLRKLSGVVWEWFGKEVDVGCLQLVYDVLAARENKEGKNEVFGEEVEDEDKSGDGEEGASDDASEGDDGSEGDDESDDKDKDEEAAESESESESSSGTASDTEVDKKTALALAEALRIPTTASGDPLSSSDAASESDSSMDDEQMLALDQHLSTIFRQRQEAIAQPAAPTGNMRKAEVQQAREDVVFFKLRLLDLLEITIRVHLAKGQVVVGLAPLILSMVAPLLHLLRLTKDKTLGEKTHKLCKNKLLKLTVELPADYNAVEEIRTIHLQMLTAKKSVLPVYLQACAQACLFFARACVKQDVAQLLVLMDVYATTMKRWSEGLSAVPASFFHDFTNWVELRQ